MLDTPRPPALNTRLDCARVRAITLDLDDTLWSVWPVIEQAEREMQAWLRVRAPASASLLADGMSLQRTRQAALEELPHIAHDLGALRREALRRVISEAGDDPQLVDPAFEVFFAARQNVTLFDDVLPALQRLHARYPLIALSNGNADVQRIGLGHLFRASVNPLSTGTSKPDVRMFHAAAQIAGCRADEVLHIGDDPHLDGVGALNSGMQFVWVNRAGHVWPADAVAKPHGQVADLSALCDLLVTT